MGQLGGPGAGSLVAWFFRLLVAKAQVQGPRDLLVFWSFGLLVFWSFGLLVVWSFGRLVVWSFCKILVASSLGWGVDA